MTTKPQKPENQTKADERNIVPLDSSYQGASVEDQVFLFWNKYQKIIIGASAVALLALAGWGVLGFVQERQEQRISAEFREAVSMDDFKAFAERHSPHPLAGVAYLNAADYHFSNGEYEDAAKYYNLAAQDLVDPLAGRAKIGHGVSLARAGETTDGLVKLEEVARNSQNYDAARAEAYYHAATLAIETGQTETARDYIDRIAEIEGAQMWASRSQGLKQALPEVPPAAEPEPAAEVPAAS